MAESYAGYLRDRATALGGGYRSTSMDISGETYQKKYATSIAENAARQAEAKESAYERKTKNLATDASAFNLQQAKEAWDLKKKESENSSIMASKFLESWGTAMTSVTSMYGDASKALSELTKSFMSGGTDGKGGISGVQGDLADLSKLMREEYASYKKDFAPAQKEFLEGAKEASAAKRQALGQMTALSKMDLSGASGRAERDVMTQSAQQNEALAQKMMSLGIDPSSGQFGSLMKKGAIQTSGMTVAAMNAARAAEKTRSAEISGKIAALAKPGEEADIALGIQKGGTDILGKSTEIGKAQADVAVGYSNAVSNLANAQTNLASGFASNVAQPYGQFAAYYLGKSGGAIDPATVNAGAGAPSYGSGAIKEQYGPFRYDLSGGKK